MAGFLDLPLELVTMIVEQLCKDSNFDNRCTHALASVCLTCRLLNNFGTKHLYHDLKCIQTFGHCSSGHSSNALILHNMFAPPGYKFSYLWTARPTS